MAEHCDTGVEIVWVFAQPEKYDNIPAGCREMTFFLMQKKGYGGKESEGCAWPEWVCCFLCPNLSRKKDGWELHRYCFSVSGYAYHGLLIQHLGFCSIRKTLSVIYNGSGKSLRSVSPAADHLREKTGHNTRQINSVKRESVVMVEKKMEINKNILIVSAKTLNRYGAQLSIMNMIKNASGCSFTWYCPGRGEKRFMEEVRLAGVEIITGDLKLSKCKRKIIHQTIVHDIWRLCHEKCYDIIHVNTGLLGTMALSLIVARLCGVPCRIAHSCSNMPAKRLYIRSVLLRAVILFSATKLAACSGLAAESMFGKRNACNAEIIPNAVDLEQFAFSRNKRNTVRRKLGFTEERVYGHVGAFNEEKNHDFLLNIFHFIVRSDSMARLLLVGNGRLEAQIKRHAEEYNIDDKIIFFGYTDQVEELLCAMDVFIFPSLFEGFGNACVEAQVSGLPCIVSDTVPQEVKRTDSVRFLSLDLGPEKWADQLLNLSVPDETERENAWKEIDGTCYDLDLLGEYVGRLYEMF